MHALYKSMSEGKKSESIIKIQGNILTEKYFMKT